MNKTNNIVISIDDVKGIFKALSCSRMKSIFETRALAFLRELHVKYDASFDLLCSCKSQGYDICNMTDYYQKEFKENEDWLRFGFHCFDECSEDDSINEFIDHYTYFQKHIKRITGQSGELLSIRLHRFIGNKQICEYLKTRGVEILLSADDKRDNYFLTKEQNDILNENKQLFDESTKFWFVKSCRRLEDSQDVEREINEYKKVNAIIIPIFTHEWLLDEVSVRNKLEICCKIQSEDR